MTEHTQIAIVGVPVDYNSSFLRGTATAPAAIRDALHSPSANLCSERGFDLAVERRWRDAGDIGSPQQQPAFEEIVAEVGAILEAGERVIAIGGDHSISWPLLQAHADRYPRLTVLHLDAHPDLYDELYGDRLSHACPFARVLEDGLAAGIVQVGVRAITAEHRSRALKGGVRMIEMKDIQDTLYLRFVNPVYVSFDLDALDPAFAPGVSHHEPGGLTTRQAVQIIQALKGRIVGLDVVELNPSRDPSSITAAAAFKIIKETAGRIVRPS